MKDYHGIFVHVSLNLLLRSKELVVDLLRAGHILRPCYVSPLILVLVPAVYDIHVLARIPFGSHVGFEEVGKLWKIKYIFRSWQKQIEAQPW